MNFTKWKSAISAVRGQAAFLLGTVFSRIVRAAILAGCLVAGLLLLSPGSAWAEGNPTRFRGPDAHTPNGPSQIQQVERTGSAGASNVKIKQVVGSGNVDQTGSGVRVNFAPGEGDIPDARAFANEIWPDGSAPVQMDPSQGHESAIYQEGSGNRSVTNQRGAGHVAVVVQEGSYNTSNVTQRGTGHIALIHQETSYHTLNLTQKGGSNNKYLLDFESVQSAPPVEHTVVQDGSNLRLYQVGRARIPFSVKQKGTDMAMVINHQ